jgi:hypothetical protein
MFASMKTFSSLLTSKQILQGIRTLPASEHPELLVAIRSAIPQFSAKEVRVIFQALTKNKIHDLVAMEDLICHLPLRIPQCSFYTIAGLMESLVKIHENRPKSKQVGNLVKNSAQVLGDILVSIVEQTSTHVDESEYIDPCNRIQSALTKIPNDAFSDEAMSVLQKLLTSE